MKNQDEKFEALINDACASVESLLKNYFNLHMKAEYQFVPFKLTVITKMAADHQFLQDPENDNMFAAYMEHILREMLKDYRMNALLEEPASKKKPSKASKTKSST